MSYAADVYVGDQAVAWAAVVVAAVVVSSTAALTLAMLFKRRPAVRHQVLLSGLAGCLASPPFAALTGLAGVSIVSLPALSPARDQADLVSALPNELAVQDDSPEAKRPHDAASPGDLPARSGAGPTAVPAATIDAGAPEGRRAALEAGAAVASARPSRCSR
jgi:hypothetical protein